MAPALLPGLSMGAAPELDVVRTAARQAVTVAVTGADQVLILAPGPQTGPVDDGGRLVGFGRDLGLGAEVPLGIAVARYFLGPVGSLGWVVGPDDDPVRVARALPRTDAVLVMGDGSACRSERAPGHVHPAAHSFDDRVQTALATGRPSDLAALDPALGHAVMAAGTDVWRVLGSTGIHVGEATELCFADPFGVAYFVATWTGRWAPRP